MNIVNARQKFYQNRKRAIEYGVVNSLSIAEWLTILEKSNGICCYCERHVGIDSLSMDHVWPMCSGGAHSADNVVAACASCNTRKSKLSADRLKEMPRYEFIEKTNGLYTTQELAELRGTSRASISLDVRIGRIKVAGIWIKDKRTYLFNQEAYDRIKLLNDESVELCVRVYGLTKEQYEQKIREDVNAIFSQNIIGMGNQDPALSQSNNSNG